MSVEKSDSTAVLAALFAGPGRASTNSTATEVDVQLEERLAQQAHASQFTSQVPSGVQQSWVS
jgi:hypothetical protein